MAEKEIKKEEELEDAAKNSEKYVKVRKESLDKILSRLEVLERLGQSTVTTDETGKEIAKMRMYRTDARELHKLVIDWNYIRTEKTLEGTFLIYEIKMLNRKNEESTAEIRLEDFIRNSEITTVTILDKKTRKQEKLEGTVTKMAVEGYSMVPQGKVPNRITWDETICQVRTDWGQELTINANRLNP